MKALILVGGYGTRMRPLTISCPKSVLPFINKPMVQFQIQALAKVGVKEVVLAINYQGDVIKEDLKLIQDKYNVKVTFVREMDPLGTAGPLKLSQKILKQGNQEGLIFVLNSDVICDFPLKELYQFHKTHNKKASIVLSSVQDPSRFGVVVTEGDKVIKFVEKPKEFISNKINAGIYLLNISVIDQIPQRFCMIQKEVFPQLAQQNQLFSLALKSDFWFDLGKPQDFLLGQKAYLNYHKINVKPQKMIQGTQFFGDCLIDPSAQIGNDCHIGPNVVIGPNAKISNGCRLKNCTIMRDTNIGKGCYIADSIISWKCNMGAWVRVESLSIIAEDVKVKEEVRISKCMILSHKAVNDSVQSQVLM